MKLRFFLLALLPAALFAQSYTASLRGVVTDPAQAAVPGATVIAKEVDRNIAHPTRTDEAGRYVLAALPPGRYSLEIDATGFQKYSHSSFDLAVQQQATIDVALALGSTSTAIDVQGSVPLVDTTSAALGQLVENKYIVSIPLLRRSALDLVALAPGINPSPAGGAGQDADKATNFVANGVRNATSDVLVDGMSAVNVEQNSGVTTLHYQPSVDSVQEFKLQTNFFSAEFGNTGTAIVNIVTKSGTNDVHGSGYEFYRDASFYANNWFANRAGQAIPDSHRHVAGATIGAPVFIPKVYNGKNRTFFFLDYEGNRSATATTKTATFPTQLERNGDFSDTRAASGLLMPIYNPFDTSKSADGKTTLRAPFAGNVIPVSLQSPAARKAVAFYPLPNQPGTLYTRQNNFVKQGTNLGWGNQISGKIDHNIDDKQRISSRYTVDWGADTYANVWGNKADNFIYGNDGARTQNFVTDYTRTQSATTVITVRYGLLRQLAHTDPQGLGFDSTTLGLPGYMSMSGVQAFPSIQPESYRSMGPQGWSIIYRGDDVNSFTGSIMKVLSGHMLKVGAESRLMRLNYRQPGYPEGSFVFSRSTTSQNVNSPGANQGNGVASMLLGWGTGGQYDIDPPASSASKYFGFYAQDDWKISSKLTLNLGLRYDFDVPRTERYNRYTWFDFAAPSPIAGKVAGYPDLRGQFRVTNDQTRSPFDMDLNNYQPRIGLAYSLNPKTSIRAGYGIFYTLSRSTVYGHLGSGFMRTTNPTWSLDGGVSEYASLDNPYPNGILQPTVLQDGAAYSLGFGFGTETRKVQNPQYQSWNYTMQRQLPGNSMLEVAYTGSKGTHLYYSGMENRDLLDPQYWSLGRAALSNNLVTNPFYGVITNSGSTLSKPTVALNILLRPYPQYGSGASGSTPTIGNSIYHALTLKYEKRFSKGLAVLAHYTWSKLIDDVGSSSSSLNFLGGNSSIQNPFNLRQERSLSTLDVPQRVVLSFDYQLPVGKGKAIGKDMGKVADLIAGGWELTGMWTLSTGFPLVPSLSGGTLWNGTQRPNLIGNPSKSGSVEDRLNMYLNAAAFSKPAADTFGNSPRTLNYLSPSLRNADAALIKNVQLGERKILQLRLEAFNVTNTPNFGVPNVKVGDAGFGTISGLMANTAPRQLQIAVKFTY